MPVAPRQISFVRAPWIGAALALALAVAAPAARADEYDAALTRAIAAKEKALDDNDPASWESALELFNAADRIRSTKESKYELASAAARLRQDDLAVEGYEAAIALGLEGTAAEKAHAFIDEKKKDMGRLVVHGPEGAEVWVGDRRRGTLPLARPLVVFSGKRSVRATLGDKNVSRDVDVRAGTTATLELGSVFPTPSASTASPTGTATLAPPTGTAAPPPSGDRGTPPPPPDRTLPWVLTIGGAGLALGGAVSVIAASSSLSSHRARLGDLCAVPSGSDDCAQAKTGQRAAAQDEVDSIATFKAVRTGGFIGLGLGVVATGVGVVMLLGDKSESAPRTMFGVVPQPGGATLSFRGAL